MARHFMELRARMSAEAKAASEVENCRLDEEMSRYERREAGPCEESELRDGTPPRQS